MLDEKIEDLPLQKEGEAEETVKEIFDLLGSLEDQEAAKDWVAQCIDDLAGEDNPFVAKGIRFLRREAFKEIEKPEKPKIGEAPETGAPAISEDTE